MSIDREIAELEEEHLILYHVIQDSYTLGRYWSHIEEVRDQHDAAKKRSAEIRERLDALFGMMQGG